MEYHVIAPEKASVPPFKQTLYSSGGGYSYSINMVRICVCACVCGSDLVLSLLLCSPAEVLCWSSGCIILPVLLPDKHLSQVSGTLTLASDSDTLTTTSLCLASPWQLEGQYRWDRSARMEIWTCWSCDVFWLKFPLSWIHWLEVRYFFLQQQSYHGCFSVCAFSAAHTLIWIHHVQELFILFFILISSQYNPTQWKISDVTGEVT